METRETGLAEERSEAGAVTVPTVATGEALQANGATLRVTSLTVRGSAPF